MTESKEQTEKEGEVTLLDLLELLIKRKMIIISVIAAASIVSIITSLILPEAYKSASVFLPISSGSSNNISQFSGLASITGIALPSSTLGGQTDKIHSILNSRTLRDKVVSTLDLEVAFKIELTGNRDPKRKAEEVLKSLIKITSGKNGEIELSVESHDPELSKKIADQYIIQLEQTLNESNLNSALRNQQINERQIVEQNKKVKIAQENLTKFQLKNKILDPTSQLQSYTTLVSDLYSNKVQLEVLLRQLESIYNPDDTRITALKSQIQSIDGQVNDIQTSNTKIGGVSFKDAPEKMIEYENLLREVEIASKLYAGVLANLAQSTLSTNPEMVYVEIIDPPLVPEVRSFPNRTLIVVAGTVAGFVLSILIIVFWEGFLNLRRQYFNHLTEKSST